MLDLNKYNGWTSLMHAMAELWKWVLPGDDVFQWSKMLIINAFPVCVCLSVYVCVCVRACARISNLQYFDIIRDQKYGLFKT